MFLKICLSFLIFFVTNSFTIANSNIYIVAKIDNEIITNHDIRKESEYLKILNPKLNQLQDSKILDLAKTSLIKEMIKKKEISKFLDLTKDNMFVDDHLKKIFSKLNYNNKDEFKKDLEKKEIYTIEQIEKKIKIELFWNELIYKKYSSLIKIDKTKLSEHLQMNFTNSKL